MGRIAVGEAIGAGFGLIRRDPVTFLVWCLGYYLISVVPQALAWPQTVEIYRLSADPDASGTVLASQAGLGLYPLIGFVAALVAMVIGPAAIFRAALFPHERRFFYLRLGLREFWVLIASVAVMIIWIVGFFVVGFPILLVTFGAALLGSIGGAVFTFIAVVIGYFAGVSVSIWIVLRFSLAPVMSFADNTFRVAESWRLTRGHAWRIFLVALGLFAMVVLAELLLFGGAFAVFSAGNPNPLRIFSEPGAMVALMSQITLPMLLIGNVVFAVFGVWSYVMGGAAWASIYRQLRPQFAETFS
jgi:hypothetical protein